MTQAAKDVMTYLIKGGYLRTWRRPSGVTCYRLYDKDTYPIKNVQVSTIKKISKRMDPENSQGWKDCFVKINDPQIAWKSLFKKAVSAAAGEIQGSAVFWICFFIYQAGYDGHCRTYGCS